MSIAAALGLGMAGADILSGMFQQRQQKKAANRGAATRRELQAIFNEQLQSSRELPGILKRAREGRLSTAQAERQKRLRRALAASGASEASSVGMMGERDLMESVERVNREAELAEKSAVDAAKQRVFQTGAQLQGIQSSVPTSFYNPLSAIKAGIGGYALGSQLGMKPGTLDPTLGKGVNAMDPRYPGLGTFNDPRGVTSEAFLTDPGTMSALGGIFNSGYNDNSGALSNLFNTSQDSYYTQ